jgi:hypothetical protein
MDIYNAAFLLLKLGLRAMPEIPILAYVVE